MAKLKDCILYIKSENTSIKFLQSCFNFYSAIIRLNISQNWILFKGLDCLISYGRSQWGCQVCSKISCLFQKFGYLKLVQVNFKCFGFFHGQFKVFFLRYLGDFVFFLHMSEDTYSFYFTSGNGPLGQAIRNCNCNYITHLLNNSCFIIYISHFQIFKMSYILLANQGKIKENQFMCQNVNLEVGEEMLVDLTMQLLK